MSTTLPEGRREHQVEHEREEDVDDDDDDDDDGISTAKINRVSKTAFKAAKMHTDDLYIWYSCFPSM